MAAVFSLLSVIVCPFHFDKKRLDDEKKKKCCWLQNCFPDGQTCTPGVCRQLHLNFLNLQGQQGKQSSRRRVFLRVYGKTCAGRVNLHTQGKIHEWLFCHTQQTLAYPCVSIMYSRNFSFSHSVFTCLLSPPISFAVIYTSSCCVSVHSFSQWWSFIYSFLFLSDFLKNQTRDVAFFFVCCQCVESDSWPHLVLFCFSKQRATMRLFKRRVSDPAPQLVSLAAINSEMDQPASSRLSNTYTTSTANSNEDYADYQTVTAMPAMVVVDDAPRKRESFLFVFLPSTRPNEFST